MFCALCLILVLLPVGAVNDCVNQKCNETLVIPSTENQTITFQLCDECTQCPTLKPRTIQAWWYYFYPNRTRTDDIRALTMEERQYQINLLGRPSLVVPGQSHDIYTNYIYNCGGENHSSLQNIRIELIPVNVSIESPNEMPVSEGSTVVIYCKTGLLDSHSVQSTFRHLDHEVQCNSVNVNSGDSTWVVNRTNHQPYTCTLYIESIQLSDSGDYYCEVSIPGMLNPVVSGPLHVEVVPTSTNFNGLILWTTLGGTVVLIAVLILVVVVYNLKTSHHPIAPQPDYQDDPHHPLLQSAPGGIYRAVEYPEEHYEQTGNGRSQPNGSSQPSVGSQLHKNFSCPDEMAKSNSEEKKPKSTKNSCMLQSINMDLYANSTNGNNDHKSKP